MGKICPECKRIKDVEIILIKRELPVPGWGGTKTYLVCFGPDCNYKEEVSDNGKLGWGR